MSVEEAKKVTAQFAGGSFVPPPRTINDITAILDQQRLTDPAAVASAHARADQPPPKTTDPNTLAQFFYQRGLAAREIGRTRQEIDDLTRAAQLAPSPGVLEELGRAEVTSGSFSSALKHFRQAIGTVPTSERGWLISLNALIAGFSALAGDFDAAEAAMQECLRVLAESNSWRDGVPPGARARWSGLAAWAQANILEARGQFVKAEASWREAVEAYARDPIASQDIVADMMRGALAQTLSRQGRLLEAENEARRALLGALSKQGRNATRTAWVLRFLTRVIAGQGRYAEAETLARTLVDMYQRMGAPPDSYLLALARDELGVALAAEGRWVEALSEYEAIRTGLIDDPETYEKLFASNATWALALLQARRAPEARKMLEGALERSLRSAGEAHPSTAEIRGLLAMASAATGERARALRDFRDATKILLTRSLDLDDETTTRPARDQRVAVILAAYIALLADTRGTPLEREAGIDAAAAAFRLADVARGQGVQRALDAGAVRAAARTPALADLVRREQDAKKQVSALSGVLANALSLPTDQQDGKVVTNLRAQLETLRRARESLAAQVEKEFPSYAELINPQPATLEQVRARLRGDEALIATLVTPERTFVWAIPQSGAVAFGAAPLGARALEAAVTRLRTALDPSAKTLDEIPAFDLASAYELYHALLEPVRAGWERAESLLIVPDGALGQLPLALLPTKPASLGPEQGPIFANYRSVPWLIRTHAVTVLPSVTALATLRALPAGDPARRPFVGFGDPYFSREQARRATRRAGRAEVAALATRGVPITLRSSPNTRGVDSSQLALLPRLPDTAEEIKSMALAMNADLTRDVFLGEQANEKIVKTLNLAGYRVMAFATHGLVPGDLDGLTQPALALTAPEVARVEGDGLLTMEEILGLRLNADWVVLSACNTASGQGAGADAISGLGRAFFYAGARALLVSNWPVETTSARQLTTDLFRRQSANPQLTRAKALQQTMNEVLDRGEFADPATKRVVFSYAHPIFWGPFTLVGDGGR